MFTSLPNLAAARLGAVAVAANDEFFAEKENLLKAEAPVFRKGVYTDRGQLMDGWETRRRRTPGHDWCIIQLGIAGVIRGVVVDTAHFTGNYPEACSVEAAAVFEGEDPTSDGVPWVEIVPMSSLQGDHVHDFAVGSPYRFTHVRLTIYPDGGVARLRVHGIAAPDLRLALGAGDAIDLAAIENGGHVTACSDQYFSVPNNLIQPGDSINMGDGWETRRRRGPGHDWAIIKLGTTGTLETIHLATTHYKGNAPGSVSIDGCRIAQNQEPLDADWFPIVHQVEVKPHSDHRFVPSDPGPVSHLRLNIYPDGGVARLRAIGTSVKEAAERAGLDWFNRLVPANAAAELLACCAATSWAAAVAAGAPFGSLEEMWAVSDAAWEAVPGEEKLQAFAAHPRIGDRRGNVWSKNEQAGAVGADDWTLSELRRLNEEYERRFGFVFLVNATGKTGDEMLTLLEQRLANDRNTEVETAAAEQAAIARLRIAKLLKGPQPEPVGSGGVSGTGAGEPTRETTGDEKGDAP